MWPTQVSFLIDGVVHLSVKLYELPAVGDVVMIGTATEGTVVSRKWTKISAEFGCAMDMVLRRVKLDLESPRRRKK